jgi:hypothetical protein
MRTDTWISDTFIRNVKVLEWEISVLWNITPSIPSIPVRVNRSWFLAVYFMLGSYYDYFSTL